MATSTNRTVPFDQIRSDLTIDVNLQSRLADALLSRSHDACHLESFQNFVDNPAPVSSSASDRSVRNTSKDSDSVTLPTDLSAGSDVDEVKSTSSSSELKSQSPKPSFHREVTRSAPNSPYAMVESLSASVSALPSSSAFPYSSIRLTPSITSSYLRPGSRFVGTQQSDKQTYTVSVELKHVDMRESFLCGYLCIQGLTQDNPTLTTYFEGELIGNKYAFKTKNKSWGANEKIDCQHWGRFPEYRPFSKASKNKDYHTKDFDQKEHIFMRWKEYFLVPNHRVKELTGASFDGFYYICFSQITGSVSGIYFHSNSEKWQQLELKHVPDCGVYGAIEFR